MEGKVMGPSFVGVYFTWGVKKPHASSRPFINFLTNCKYLKPSEGSSCQYSNYQFIDSELLQILGSPNDHLDSIPTFVETIQKLKIDIKRIPNGTGFNKCLKSKGVTIQADNELLNSKFANQPSHSVSQCNTFSTNHLYHILSRMKILYHKYDFILERMQNTISWFSFLKEYGTNDWLKMCYTVIHSFSIHHRNHSLLMAMEH
ncbi:hypothetical protein LXL04_016539 [Taraxacum kok-saghyz]